MYFLGQAGNYKASDILKHTFACGTKSDSEKLVKHLAKRYNTKEENVRLYHTGRTALSEAIKIILTKEDHKSKEKPEILVTSLTCYAVVEAVKAAGCESVFADVEPETLHYNAETLEQSFKKHGNIKAIVIQNNLGHPCKIKEIEKIAEKHCVPIIEDLAHCAGINYEDGREAGTIGVASALSFGKGKSIDTISGGALVVNTKKLSDFIDLDGVKMPEIAIKNPSFGDRFRDRFYPLFGAMIRGFYHIKMGRYFTSFLLKTHQIKRSADAPLNNKIRLTNWQAKLALNQLEKTPRNRIALREFFFVENREETLKELSKHGFIMDDVWYGCPVSPDRYFAKSGFNSEECPVAVAIAKHIVNLPNHYDRRKMQPARKIIEKTQISDIMTKVEIKTETKKTKKAKKTEGGK